LVAGCLEELEAEAKALVADAENRVAGRVPVSAQTGEGAPVAEIERLAVETELMFIIIGSHGRSGPSRLLLGSVAEGVVRSAQQPLWSSLRVQNSSPVKCTATGNPGWPLADDLA
jgi:nucleotide-binding universal stress UspA family protein